MTALYSYMILTFILLCSAPVLADTPASNAHPEWFQCVSDSDCMLTCVSCGPVVINQQYKDYAAQVLPECSTRTPCNPHDPTQQTACQDHQCVKAFRGQFR